MGHARRNLDPVAGPQHVQIVTELEDSSSAENEVELCNAHMAMPRFRKAGRQQFLLHVQAVTVAIDPPGGSTIEPRERDCSAVGVDDHADEPARQRPTAQSAPDINRFRLGIACQRDAVGRQADFLQMLHIAELTAADLREPSVEEALSRLLCEVVDSRGSLGFVAPLSGDAARHYWSGVADEVAAGANVALASTLDGELIGSVQLHLSPWPDGPHRAEVAKLMVSSRARRKGVGRALMDAIEAVAIERRRTLLILNTRVGDPSERLYGARGYTCFGRVPDYLTDGTRLFDKSYWFLDLRDRSR